MKENVYMLLNKETNQNTGVIQKQMNTEVKEQEIILNYIVDSEDSKIENALYDLSAVKIRIERVNKSLRQLIKQMKIEIGIVGIIGIILIIICVFVLLHFI